MKGFLFFLLLVGFQIAEGQRWNSVMKDAPQKDPDFSAALVTVLSAAGQDFASLPKKMESHQNTDTTWDISLKLPGAHEATLNKSNGAATLTEAFTFKDDQGLDQLLQKIKASLPDDYVYSLDYDTASQTYDYTFEINPMSKMKHIGYPTYFHMTGDKETVLLFIGHSPAWLNNPFVGKSPGPGSH